MTSTAGSTASGNVQFRLVSSGTTTSYTGDGTSGLFIWGAQLEQVTYQTTPGTYVATTSAAYYGPRFDYDPVTLAAKGLLIEQQRTNLSLHSGTTAANWTAVGGTIANTGKLSPDGSANMLRFTEDTATSAHQTFVTTVPGTFPALTPHTVSVYLAAGTRRYVVVNAGTNINGWGVTVDTTNWAITGSFSTGVGAYISSTITNVGNGIYRITVTGQATAIDAQAYVVVAGSLVSNATAPNTAYLGNGSTFFAWGAQFESGSFATSYIPTVASQVTRSADVATMTGTNFSSWYNQSEGTFVSSSDTVGAPTVAGFIFIASDGTQNERVQTVFEPSAITSTVIDGNVTQANFTASYTINQPAKAAIAYKVNDFAASFNGAAATTDTSGTLPTVNRMTFGSSWDGLNFYLNGHIRQIAYYNTRLPNAQLQELTAPSLAITLNLDFINGTYDA
jgi:hypothetical protein